MYVAGWIPASSLTARERRSILRIPQQEDIEHSSEEESITESEAGLETDLPKRRLSKTSRKVRHAPGQLIGFTKKRGRQTVMLAKHIPGGKHLFPQSETPTDNLQDLNLYRRDPVRRRTYDPDLRALKVKVHKRLAAVTNQNRERKPGEADHYNTPSDPLGARDPSKPFEWTLVGSIDRHTVEH
eukprot:GHVQ01043646.1.p1 GENE.GHVQ01043646.1~~GHVQ01043646.1.p1  ORF type:complete len:184 (+),score=15.34 GHVQ01043646.1:918-1469(+)